MFFQRQRYKLSKSNLSLALTPCSIRFDLSLPLTTLPFVLQYSQLAGICIHIESARNDEYAVSPLCHEYGAFTFKTFAI